MNFFCDLDGTLLDISEKYHGLYATLAGELGFPALPKEAYWSLRRAGVGTADILRRAGAQEWVSEFQSRWLLRIESEEWISRDQPIAGASAALERMKAAGRVVLVTLRRCSPEVQLLQTGLRPLIDLVLSAPAGPDPWQTKVELVSRMLPGFDGTKGVFIGDMITDIRAGKALGTRTVGVASGLSSEEILRQANPDVIYPTIAAFARTETNSARAAGCAP